MGVTRYMWLAVAPALLYCGWQFARRSGWSGGLTTVQRTHDSGIYDPAGAGHTVKIVQFYAGDGVLTEGDDTLVCYDVVNARAVRLDPPVSDMWPSRNRCVSVHPLRDTRYTLTVDGTDGKTVLASFELRVVPDQATLPEITSFRSESCKRDYLGKPIFRLSFSARNAEIVSIDPRVLGPLHGAPYGQFYVSPEQATTYTLTASGKNGHASKRQLTVNPALCK